MKKFGHTRGLGVRDSRINLSEDWDNLSEKNFDLPDKYMKTPSEGTDYVVRGVHCMRLDRTIIHLVE